MKQKATRKKTSEEKREELIRLIMQMTDDQAREVLKRWQAMKAAEAQQAAEEEETHKAAAEMLLQFFMQAMNERDGSCNADAQDGYNIAALQQAFPGTAPDSLLAKSFLVFCDGAGAGIEIAQKVQEMSAGTNAV